MTARHLEVERKYEVDTGVALPELTRLPKVAAVEPVLQSTLDAVYSDTADLTLATAGITLRRRTGGSDAGWHLKLPRGGDDRAELAEPLRDDDGGLPPELVRHIRGWLRDRELMPVATLSTSRVVHRLVGDDGKVLAEVSDDVVTATAHPDHGAATATTWREWEIELVDGSRKLLAAADELFAGVGAVRSRWPSKLHHALQGTAAPSSAVAPGDTEPNDTAPPGSAAAVLADYLAIQLAAVLERDPDVRSSEPDAVHKVRVATRRTRSVLSTYRPLFDRTVTDPLRAELKWFAGVLGAARDVEVQRDHLLAATAAEPAELVVGPVDARIEAELRSDYAAAHRALLEVMDSARYFRLLDALGAVATRPPFTELAAGKAKRVLAKRVRVACRELQALGSAEPPAEAGARDHWLHEIRKAAKRVRYAAELAEPALGRSARALIAAAQELQEILGDHQDSVVIRGTLREIGVRLRADGEDTFTIGRLHALQQVRAEAAEAAFRRSWTGSCADQLRNWEK